LAEGVLSIVSDSEVRSLSKLNSEAIGTAPGNCGDNFVKTASNCIDCWVELVSSDSVEIATDGNNGELSFWFGDVDQVIELVSALEVEGIWFTDKDNSAKLSEGWSDRVEVGAVSRSNVNVVREIIELSSLVHVGSVNEDVVNPELELVPSAFLCDVDSDCVGTVSVVQKDCAEVVLGDRSIPEAK
jgi:hypothetical protein